MEEQSNPCRGLCFAECRGWEAVPHTRYPLLSCLNHLLPTCKGTGEESPVRTAQPRTSKAAGSCHLELPDTITRQQASARRGWNRVHHLPVELPEGSFAQQGTFCRLPVGVCYQTWGCVSSGGSLSHHDNNLIYANN